MANNTTTKLTIRVNGKEVEKTLDAMGKELKELNKEVRRMNEGDPNFQNRVRELQTLRREYNGLREDVYGANNATNQFVEGLKGVGAGIVAAFSVDKVLELTKALYDNVERVRQFKTEVSAMTGLDGSQLSGATTGTMALAQTYNKEQSEILISANTMAKQLSITYEEALSEIKRGFQEGADVSGDMLEQIKEYAPFIKEAGGEAQDLVNIIKAGVVDGVYNDKAIDAVKEGLLRIREMTPATRDAITSLGIDVDDMLAKIKSGQMSYMDAMMLVSKEMDKLGNKSTVTGQALADIFGGPGEDAGFKYISNLYKMNEGVGKLSQAQKDYNRVKEIELEANQKSAVLFERLTGEGSKLNEFLTNGKLALVEFTSALFGISEARASDDIRDQQVSLKVLQAELVNTNTSTARRKEILEQLQAIYLDIFKNLDLETASNEDLSKAIDKVSESLQRKYALQKAQEEVEDAAKISAKADVDVASLKADLENKIQKLAVEHKIEIPVDINQKSLIEKATWLDKQLEGKTKAFSFDLTSMNGLVTELSQAEMISVNFARKLREAEQHSALVVQNLTGLTPLQKKTNDFLSNQLSSFQKMITDGQNAQQSKADPGRADELKRQAKEAADARKRAQKEAEQAAKRIRDERIREAKSLHETLLKEQESFSKKISDAVFNDEQAGIDLMKDGLQKELDQQKLNSEKKILAVTEEINQINKLREEYLKKAEKLELSAKNAGKGENKDQYLSDASKYRELAEKQIQIIGYKNSTINALDAKSTADQLKIYSKYRSKEIELRQKANDDLINSKKIEFNEELSQATSLEEAKKILKEKYGVTELNHITTLTDARNELMKEQNKVMLQEQLGALEIELSEIQKLLNDDALSRENGLQILSDEDRDKQVENLKAVGLAISEVNAAVSGEKAEQSDEDSAKEKNARSQVLSGISLLAYSADDWDQAFEQLDTAGGEVEKFAAKIKLVEMALQTVMAGWSMMTEMQNKSLDKSLKKYEQNNTARKKSLDDQLAAGYISQASYNAQVEALEEELAAKRAEISYKQAMNEWKMQLIGGLANTALAVTGALGMKPWTPANFALAGIVGGLGLLQTGVIAANKPQKSNFYATGGPTVGLGYTDETGHEVAGTVHANEYVIPEWLLKDPVVADMREFIEARRVGSGSFQNIPNSYADGGTVEPVQSVSRENVSSDIALFTILQQLSQQIEQSNMLYQKLLIEGVRLPRTMEGAKKLSEDIKQYESFIKQTKK